MALCPLVEMDGRWIAGVAQPDEELAELCYIPVFGGGFGLGATEVMGWPVSRKRFFLDWLETRRTSEGKALSGSGGTRTVRRYGADQMPAPAAAAPRPPSISRPTVPRR